MKWPENYSKPQLSNPSTMETLETAKIEMTSQDVFFEILLEMFTEHIEATSIQEEQIIKERILEFIKNPGE